MAMKYSPTESALLEILPSNGDRITVKELAEKYYKKKKRAMPFHGRIFIANSVRSLSEKVKRNREKFRVKRTPKIGPHGIEVWIE